MCISAPVWISHSPTISSTPSSASSSSFVPLPTRFAVFIENGVPRHGRLSGHAALQSGARLPVTKNTFSAPSRTTYMASMLVFSVVMADAAMIERVVSMDVAEAAAGRW